MAHPSECRTAAIKWDREHLETFGGTSRTANTRLWQDRWCDPSKVSKCPTCRALLAVITLQPTRPYLPTNVGPPLHDWSQDHQPYRPISHPGSCQGVLKAFGTWWYSKNTRWGRFPSMHMMGKLFFGPPTCLWVCWKADLCLWVACLASRLDTSLKDVSNLTCFDIGYVSMTGSNLRLFRRFLGTKVGRSAIFAFSHASPRWKHGRRKDDSKENVSKCSRDHHPKLEQAKRLQTPRSPPTGT